MSKNFTQYTISFILINWQLGKHYTELEKNQTKLIYLRMQFRLGVSVHVKRTNSISFMIHFLLNFTKNYSVVVFSTSFQFLLLLLVFVIFLCYKCLFFKGLFLVSAIYFFYTFFEVV